MIASLIESVQFINRTWLIERQQLLRKQALAHPEDEDLCGHLPLVNNEGLDGAGCIAIRGEGEATCTCREDEGRMQVIMSQAECPLSVIQGSVVLGALP